MNDLSTIVSIYKIERGLRSDEAVAATLGMRKTTFSNYRNGDRRLPDTAIVRLAEGAGLPVAEVLVAANLAWKGTRHEDRGFWADRMGDTSPGVVRNPIDQGQQERSTSSKV